MFQTRRVSHLLALGDGNRDTGAKWYLGLFLSDVLATAYHCVVDTGVQKGDIVGIWGAGKHTESHASLSDFHN